MIINRLDLFLKKASAFKTIVVFGRRTSPFQWTDVLGRSLLGLGPDRTPGAVQRRRSKPDRYKKRKILQGMKYLSSEKVGNHK